MTHPALDLDAYFRRIDYTGPREASLAALHGMITAHARNIPFENLDVLLARPIGLDAPALMQKLVHEKRGGYCFEQNGLFLLVLEALGFAVVPLSGRTRWQRPRELTPPRTHLFLRVEIEGVSWLADVGIGSATPTAPIRLELDTEQPTPHEPRRVVREGARYFHQVKISGDWQDVCEFTLEEMPLIDRELANWYTSTHPQSHFLTRLLVTRALPAGRRRTLLDRELTLREASGQAEKRLVNSPEELLVVLAEHFGLHFPAGTRFGPPGSPWPA